MIYVVTTIYCTGGNMCNLLCDLPRNVITSLPCKVSWYRHSFILLSLPELKASRLISEHCSPHLSVLKQVRLKSSSSADPYYHRCREVSRRKGHCLCHLATCAEHWRRTAAQRETDSLRIAAFIFLCCLKKRNQEWRQHIKQGRVLLNSANEVMASVEKVIKRE